MNAQHSTGSALWYTRDEHLDAVRKVLGQIDLDPASDEYGNRRVQAKRIITAAEDGLSVPWSRGEPVTIYVNPPGRKAYRKGQVRGPEHRPLPQLFWERLMLLRRAGGLIDAVVAAFSLEQFQAIQGNQPMASFPFCIPASRVHWLPPEGQVANSPTHAAAFVYVPGNLDRTAIFKAEFSRFGVVRC